MSGQFGLDLKPRNGNTGALISCARIDCLEFSVKGLPWQLIVSRFLGLDPTEFERMERGMRGYPFRVRRGNVQVLWDADCEQRPVKCLISGQGIDEITVDAVELIRSVFLYNKSCSSPVKAPFGQVHLAVDDRTGRISAQLISDHITGGFLVSRFRTAQRISGFTIDSDSGLSDTGETWYLGSFKGDRLVRCYDKQRERISAGEDDPGPWYRFELQARRKYATVLAAALAAEGIDGAGGILRGVIDFRSKDSENDTRRSPLSWWMTFCDGLAIIRTGVGKTPMTLEKIASWLQKSVSRRLAEVRAILGNGWLEDLLRYGERRTDQGVITALSEQMRINPEYLGMVREKFSESSYIPF